MKKTIAIVAMLLSSLLLTNAAFSEDEGPLNVLSEGNIQNSKDFKEPSFQSIQDRDYTEIETELSLCVAEAIENHPDIKKARANAEQSWASLGSARSAYYPHISFSSSYTVGADQPSRESISRYNHGFSLRQYITDFGKTSNTLKVSIENYAAALFDLKAEENAVICDVKTSFYECVASKYIVLANEDSVNKFSEHLNEAKALYISGKAAKIDITTAEVNLINAEYALTEAQNEFQVAMLKLYNSMGCRPSKELKLEMMDLSSETTLDYILDELLKYAKDERPDMLSSEAMLRASKASARAASAEFYPTISGSAGYSWGDEHYPMDHSWQAGISMSVNITDGNSTVYKVREARAKIKASEASNERVWQNISLEVESSYITMLNNEKNLKVSDKSLKLAEENFDLANHRYKLGVGSSTEFIDAQNDLLQAKTNRIKAGLNYYSSIASLEKAVGRELPKRKFINKDKEIPKSEKINGADSYKILESSSESKEKQEDTKNITEPQKQ